MTHLKVQIIAQSPLCFSERRPSGQFRYSAGYVPGATLRGAVAVRMLQRGQERTPSFRRLFGVGQPPAALFRHGYPGDFVLPHTTLSCKDNPGFGRSEQSHGVFDALIDRLCFEQLQPPGVLYLPRCPRYPNCTPGRAESFGGFYSVQDGIYRKQEIRQRLLTRVGINRKRMAAEDELLYSPLVLSESWWSKEGDKPQVHRATFSGSVWVEDELAEDLAKALQKVTHLGSGTARGLGEVEILEPVKASDDKEKRALAIKRRIDDFNLTLQTRWKEVGQLCENKFSDCPQVFVINLRSDAILKEKEWLPTMVLTPEMLSKVTGVTDPSLRLLRAYASYDYRGGWNIGQRLPKDTELITRMGSVFVFQTSEMGRWLQPLADLEISGLGERTAEGFGEIFICDAFHVEGREAR